MKYWIKEKRMIGAVCVGEVFSRLPNAYSPDYGQWFFRFGLEYEAGPFHSRAEARQELVKFEDQWILDNAESLNGE